MAKRRDSVYSIRNKRDCSGKAMASKYRDYVFALELIIDLVLLASPWFPMLIGASSSIILVHYLWFHY